MLSLTRLLPFMGTHRCTWYLHWRTQYKRLLPFMSTYRCTWWPHRWAQYTHHGSLRHLPLQRYTYLYLLTTSAHHLPLSYNIDNIDKSMTATTMTTTTTTAGPMVRGWLRYWRRCHPTRAHSPPHPCHGPVPGTASRPRRRRRRPRR